MNILRRFLHQSFLPALTLLAVVATSAPVAYAATTLASNLQGTYTLSSLKLVANGQPQNVGHPMETAKITSTGLTPSNLVPDLLRHVGFILKFTGVKATPTLYSASFTGKTSAGKAQFVAGSSLQATLTASGLTVKAALKGTNLGHAFTGTLTIVLKKSA